MSQLLARALAYKLQITVQLLPNHNINPHASLQLLHIALTYKLQSRIVSKITLGCQLDLVKSSVVLIRSDSTNYR